jgi:heme-degrading monooxygenase HmoA
MFSVIFKVHPKSDRWDDYLGVAKMLRPELEQVDGFIENVRYKSLSRPGWLLSLSGWRDEKSVVRWRTAQRHHIAQEKGRSTILLDYHLRVGEITQDTQVPAGHRIAEQRLDETETGEGTTVTFVDAKSPKGSIELSDASGIADHLGLNPDAVGLLKWEVFDAVLTPGDVILMMVWKFASFGSTSNTTENTMPSRLDCDDDANRLKQRRRSPFRCRSRRSRPAR